MYTRNPELVKSILKETENGQLITTVDCIIQVPERYVDRGTTVIGAVTYTLAIFALITKEGHYAVSLTNASIRILPSRIIKTTIDGVPYYNFHFNAYSVISDNLNLVRNDLIIFDIFEEFFINGKIPWYIDYEDLGKIFDTAKEYANSPIASNYRIPELIAAFVSRDPTDRTVYYRQVAKDRPYLNEHPAVYIPLKSVFYAATSTTSKLAGNYFSDGLVSSLLHPTTQVEHLEQILRA